MKTNTSSAAPLLAAVFLTVIFTPASGAKDEAATAKVEPVYSVDVYDPKRDAGKDLEATVALAEKGKKRILIQLGGDWCGWCRAMSRFFHENEKVGAKLASDFIIMKVNYSDENKNSFFLRDFPNFESFPHLYVLDSDGKVLHSQPTGDFERTETTYNEKAIFAFLDKWDGKE